MAQRDSTVTALRDAFGLGPRELVAIVGAGGKTTILHTLGRELAAEGQRVILTTTTKMASDQVSDPVCWSADAQEIRSAFVPGTPLFVLSHTEKGKVSGLDPDAVDRLFTRTVADFVIVEADGARTMSIKAPADHEPEIPDATTTAIVVMGADAFGRPFSAVAHRTERISGLIGVTADDVVTPGRAAELLLHPDGGLKAIPGTARAVVAITKVEPANAIAVAELREILNGHRRIDRCVLLHRPPG